MAKGKPKFRQKREKPEFDQLIVDLARVTRVTKGGKQLSFRACLVIGDRKGRVGYGVEKGKDVQIAVQKAFNQAKKNLITVPVVNETIPHTVEAKYKAGKVLIKPAPAGSGIIAGSVIRIVLEMAGVPNASAKMLSKTNNKITNIKATFKAFEQFKVKAKPKAAKKETQEETKAQKPKKSAPKKTAAKKKETKTEVTA
ncbi:30S ribosomal protein S5 [Candidatus Nomurabacteria bacterium]|nr:30S ribosomal protein S5 [Candidatus Nomurabacteria bacterium]